MAGDTRMTIGKPTATRSLSTQTPTALRWLALLSAAAFLLSLVPLYTAARYSYAGVDDYRYGATTHAVWEQTGSLRAVLAEAANVAKQTYTQWQGSLSAIFLMSLQPGIFGDSCYGLSTAVLLTVLAFSLLGFVCTLCACTLGMDRNASLCVAALTAFCCIQFVPTPVESYYWFNGGIYYTFYFSVSLLAAALLLRRHRKKSPLQWLLLPLMPLLGTGNLVTGLLCLATLSLYAFWLLCVKKKGDWLALVSLALLAAAFAVNAFAPGNGVRQTEHIESAQSAVSAVLAALGDGARYTLKWCAGPTPFALLLAVPLFWRWAEESPLPFRFPPLVTLASFLLLSAGFAPSEYALSAAGEARIVDIQFYLFVLLTLVNLLWYTGWLRRHITLDARAARRAGAAILVIGALLCGLLAIRTRDVASVSAVRMQLNGSARAYADVWKARLSRLRDPAQDVVTLPKLTKQPPLLCMVDVAVDETGEYYWYNEQLAAYFHKRQVLREP